MGFKKFIGLSVLILFFLPFMVLGQRYDFKTYSVSQGLPHSQVHSLLQTSDGYLWIGTYGGGLIKFDGEKYSSYTTEDGLKDNSVEFIYEDSRGSLWVATYNSGIARMEDDEFVYPINNSILDTADVYAIEEVRDGELWIGTYRAGIFIYDGIELDRLTTKEGLADQTVWDFRKDSDGNIWIATNRGISVYNGDTFTNYTIEDGLSSESIYRIVPNPNGDLWFASSNGITVWDGSSFSAITEIKGIELNSIYDLVAASDGAMWIGTQANGVIVYSDSTSKHITQNNGLSSNYIYDIYEDQNENIWIATDEDGINLYNGDAFTFYGTESGLNSPIVHALHKDRSGSIWVGTYNGIFLFEDGKYKEVPFPEGYENPKEVWDIAEFRNGDLLFVMPDNTIYSYDGAQWTNYSEANNLDLWFTYDLYIDQDNTLWITTDVGLFHLSEDGLIHYTREDGLISDIVYKVYEHKGYFWIATYSGISRFDGSSFTNYTTSDGLGHRDISEIVSDKKGNLWLGTGGGVTLLELDQDGDVVNVKNFGSETGMKLVATQNLWFDEAGILWQGTNGGIHQLNVPEYWKTGEMSLIHYALSERGIGIETNYRSTLSLDDNKALFGTTEGVLEVTPDRIEYKSEYIPLHITDVLRNSHEIVWDQYADSLSYIFGRPEFPEVTFPYGQHTYSISYAATVFGNTSNKKYRYKLRGFDDEWSRPTDSRTAIFTNLDPGEYTFLVQVKNENSEWADNQEEYNFAVAFPFWQMYWFYGLILLTVAGLIYGYIRIRLNILEKKRLKKAVEEQTRELKEALEEKEILIKEIHHRVKNNLAVISGLLELQMGYTEDDFALRVLTESQLRVRSISMIHEKLYQNKRLAEIDFRKYVDELSEIIAYSFSHMDKKIKVRSETADIRLGIDQGIPCGLILNELISNSFEHAFVDRTSGEIVIKFEEKGEKLVLSVMDNGKGLPEDFSIDESETLGLTLVETLSQQLQGKFSIVNKEPGTAFIVQFTKEDAPLKVPV